jgi:type II secretion system protein N
VSASSKKDQIQAQVDLLDCDLGKLGVLAYAGNLKGGGIVNGQVQVEGSLNDITTLLGSANLALKQIRIEEQNVMGFNLPAMVVSEGKIDLKIEGGKLVVKTVTLGKGNDDILLSLTGDIALNRAINYSTLNLRTVFGFSENVKQNIGLLDSILGVGKGSDGKYAYKLTGSLGAPFPMPDPAK